MGLIGRVDSEYSSAQYCTALQNTKEHILVLLLLLLLRLFLLLGRMERLLGGGRKAQIRPPLDEGPIKARALVPMVGP